MSIENDDFWVEDTLRGLSARECLLQLVCPDVTSWEPSAIVEMLERHRVGSVFIAQNSSSRWKELTAAIGTCAGVPVLVASDFEHGAGCMISDGATDFPWAMAAGAARDPSLAFEMGVATSREGRAHGAHWTLGPQVDLQINPDNPVVNVRGIGEGVTTVTSIAREWIRGIQEDGLMAACAKHFPGDGMDDRDQHLCTSVNPLPMKAWMETYGKVWRAVIDAGVETIMVGHLALPAWDAGKRNDAPPATLSRKIQIDLLRDKLGFRGLILSDAISMGGIGSRVKSDEIAVENLRAGSDVVLFAQVQRDIPPLEAALASGRLKESEIRDSVRRVLKLKARLGLRRKGKTISFSRKRAERAARTMARKSITVLRKSPAVTGPLKRGARVLTVSVFYADAPPHLRSSLPAVDDELQAMGLRVDHLDNPDGAELTKIAGNYDRVFVNISILPHSKVGTVRLVAPLVKTFWESFWTDFQHVVFTSFGSPYLLREYPHLPNLILAYGNSECSQRTAAQFWTGRIAAQGKVPVTQTKR